jgi:protein TonB
MRHPFAILVPVLALAACGGPPSLDRPDGSFDRARYLALNTRECADGMRRANASVPPALADRLCGCIMNRMMAASSDEDLRGYHRTGFVPVSKMRTATRQCGGPTGPGTPLPAMDDIPGPGEPDYSPEAPPPAEPAPSMNDGTPPPVVAPPEPGTDASSATGRARARANLASYISPDDYPAAALRNNEQGSVAFTLDIGPDGRVAACRISQSSGSAALDSATCRIMRSRARYTPARNARGVAVADRQQATVRWALPAG